MLTRVLSIDGGGIRGIIPGMVLAELERRTNKPIAELFHYVAGTSTGGILALGLSIPGRPGKPRFTADRMVDLYVDEGATIFHRSAWHAIAAIDNLDGPKYEPDGIEGVLKREFEEGSRFGSLLRKVLIPAYDIEGREPFFFRNYSPGTKSDPVDPAVMALPAWRVARATSSAPTYFAPERLETLTVQVKGEEKQRAFIDGGVFANNPAMCVLVDVLRGGTPLEDIAMLSLGTGNLDRSIPYDKARGWGLMSWAHPLIDTLMDGVTDTVDREVQELLADGNYIRLQTDLPEVEQDLDDARPQNIEALKKTATRMIVENEEAFEVLRKWF